MQRRELFRTRLAARAWLLALCLAFLVSAAAAQPLDSQALKAALDQLMSSPLANGARVGVAFYSADDSVRIYGHRDSTALVPASLQKLYTGIGVLTAWGGEHRFRTQIGSSGEISGGVLKGDLVVKGGGDPSWVEDLYPQGPHRVFELWADSLAALGIRKVEGDLIGDISLHPSFPFNPLWEKKDFTKGWAPAVAALSFNANQLTLNLRGASRAGLKASVSPKRGYSYFTLDNRVQTGGRRGKASTWATLAPDNRGLTLRGKLGVNTSSSHTLPVRQPPLFALLNLRNALNSKGIEVAGKIRIRELALPADSLRTLFIFNSLPLKEMLPVMLGQSSNLIAESLLCELGASPDSGAVYIERLLESSGLSLSEFNAADGSGLARQNRCSASQLALALCHARHQEWFDIFQNSLARPGEKGTLEDRFPQLKGKSLLWAKSGTMSDISNLAGYLLAADGQLHAFAIFCDGPRNNANARRWQEQICALLLRYSGANYSGL